MQIIAQMKLRIFVLYKIYLFILERAPVGGRDRGRRKKNLKADSPLSMEPKAGFDPKTLRS